MNKIILSLITALCFILVGCAKDMQPGNYDVAEVGKIKKVVPGVIISKRPVNILSKPTEPVNVPAGEMASEVDNAPNRTRGVEYVIRLNSGSIISLVQSEDLHLKNKQRILVIYGNNTRVVADDGSDDY